MESTLEEINSFVSPVDPQLHALIEDMRNTIQALRDEVTDLREELYSYQERSELERAFDRKRLSKLETPEIQPKQKDRGVVLRALLAAYGGKMLEAEARKKMGLKRNQFSTLLGTLEEHIEISPYHLDNRQNLLILKNKID